MTRSAVALGVLLPIALALGAPVATAERIAGRTHKVEAQGTYPVFRYEPSEITAGVGDKVVWVNTTSTGHHVTPYDGPWPKSVDHLHLAAVQKVSFRFKKPGTYRYYCDLQFHGQLIGPLCIGQCGTVVVE